MKKLSIIIALIALAFGVEAAETFILKGQVLDQNGSAINKAKISNTSDPTESCYSDGQGLFTLYASSEIESIKVEKKGFLPYTNKVNGKTFLTVRLTPQIQIDSLQVVSEEEVVMSLEIHDMAVEANSPRVFGNRRMKQSFASGAMYEVQPDFNRESYSPINENGFHRVLDEPLSTFSADVDRASYANVRRFINHGQLPPVDAVRVEEMINYFNYKYPSPKGDDPVDIYTEVAKAPWNQDHYVMHIGIKARELDKSKLPESNLVFLIDVSGSMSSPNKLPLLKSAMKMLVGELRDNDRVAMVVYAGAAGLVLPSTPGYEKGKINAAIDQLESGGSTAGGAGIKLAYEVASKQFIDGGNNRVILATDGDFNIGASSDGEMQRLIEAKRESGVFLTVLGFGMGNYKDSKMEILADKGNGNYAYIDNITEAKKTLVGEFGSTLFTVAKDVKLQVEFNPSTVDEYRLIGYENRKLNKEDFNDDKKDAGEMGAGHVVTALYEIVPKGKGGGAKVDPLKYQAPEKIDIDKVKYSDELATVKVRYKAPDGSVSKLLSEEVSNDVQRFEMASNNLQWSASVATFGMLLRKSSHKGDMDYDKLIAQAKSAVGKDEEGYRRECLQLMRSAALLEKNTASK